MTTRFENPATRRQALRAGLAAMAGGVVLDARRAQAQAKIPQDQVQYQKTPKDGQMCSGCVNFEAPNGCKIVAGTIDPNGWCIAYAPKNA